MKNLLSILLLLLGLSASSQQAIPDVQAIEKPGVGYVFVNSNQQPVNNQIWDEAESFANGFSRVLKNNKFSFVNNMGFAIAPAEFDAARNFNHKLAAVEKNGKWGFINENGRTAIPFNYDIVFDFKDTITAVFSNKSWKLINRKGIILYTPDIDVFHGFDNQIASVEKQGRKGKMNLKGEINWTGETVSSGFQRLTPPVSNNVAAQCPENIDFEEGSFQNWRCFTGRVDSVGTTNVITVNPSAPINNRHRIITRNTPAAIDPFGLFSLNPPDGSNFAVRLGNTNIGAQSERIQYTIRVPLNDSNFSIRYDYAVVFQDPGHTAWTQPRFIAQLFDSAANAYVSCASFEYISTSNLPGFIRSTVDTSVIYKDWSSVFISLRGYAGKTMYLEFTTADCVRRGHWGYAYVDVESVCGQTVTMEYDCNYPNITTLDAPPGFQTYNWWNQDFSTTLATGQHVVLNPGPPANSTVWVEMIPFNDFGCRDTIPVRLTGTFNPSFHASDTSVICAPHSFTFYNHEIPSRNAWWDFGDGTTGSGDTVTHVYNLPGTYIVTLTVMLPGGCTGTSQDTIRILQPTGSFTYTGGDFCNRRDVRFTATVSNVDSLFWDFGDGTVLHTTQTTVTHTYGNAGVYLPTLTIHSNSGCSFTYPGADSIRIEMLNASFIIREERSCSNTIIHFTDQSQSLFGIASYSWNFGDGNTGSGNNVSHTYSSNGIYNVQLIITGVTGCKDTFNMPVPVTIFNSPSVSISGPSVTCPATPVTFNSSVQSTDAIATLEWSSTDGGTGSGNDYTHSFNLPGSYTVQLIATTVNGCADTSYHTIIVHAIPVVTPVTNQTVCNGATINSINLSSNPSGSTISWTNDYPSIGLAASGTGDIPTFTAVNTGSTQAIANITVTAVSNGCSSTTETFTITVNPDPTIFQPSNQTVCNGGVTTGVIFNSFTSAVSAATNFNWTNDQPSIGLPASGTGNIPVFTAINNTNAPIIANITITPITGSCNGNPVVFTITVNPTPDMAQPGNLSLCNGATSSAIPFSGTVSPISYSWTNDQPSIGLAATGNGNLPAFTAANTGTTVLTANIAVVPTSNGCEGPTKYFTIVVSPTPDLVRPANQSVCNGSATDPVQFNGSVAATNFNWSNNLPSIGLAAGGAGNIPSFNPVNNDLTINTATITVTPEINGCPGTPQDFTITVMPRADFTQPLNQFICNGMSSAPMSFNGTLNNTTYTWTNSNTAIGLAASGTGNIDPFNAVNNTNTQVSATVTVTATANNCPGNTKTFIINVDPTPSMAEPADQELCNGSTTNAVSFTGTVAGTTFNWINSNPAIGLAPNGTGNIPAFTVTNNFSYPITAIISVTGTANTCNSVTRVFTIKVNPSPDINPLYDQAVCNGIVTDTIELTGPVMGTVYSWTNDKPSIGLPASGTGDIPAFTAINNSSNDVIANISVRGSVSTVCNDATKSFKITVHPTPRVSASPDTTICRGSNFNLQATGAHEYIWDPPTSLNCFDCANPVATPSDSIRYSVLGISNRGCKAYDTVLLNVIHPFDMLVSPDDTICSGRAVSLHARKAQRYLWSPSTGLSGTDIADPVATPAATTNYQVIGYDDHHCFTDTGHINITVGPNPALEIGPDVTASAGSSVTFNPVTQNGPIVSWNWSPSTNLSCTDCPNPTATVANNTTYLLTVENTYGCIVTDTVVIITFCKNSQVFIPNAFTPDGDGINDVLMVRGNGITVKSFRVFNRWGNVVFEKQQFSPNDPRFGWDGRVRGVLASPDVYVFTAEVTCDNGVVYTYKGNTTILK